MKEVKTEPKDEAEKAILDLLERRDSGKTICPSEAARVVGGDKDFRVYMDLVRDAAKVLVAAGEIEVTQKGEVVNLDEVKGPVRLSRVKA